VEAITVTTNLDTAFRDLSTPLLADACVRLELPLRAAAPGIRPLLPGSSAAGRALPAQHAGSVDVFLEALEAAQAGDILVIDNEGRLDEGCIGDLTVMEARASGVIGVVLWGAHRDSRELVALGVPVWSHGRFPFGPRTTRPRNPAALQHARLGDVMVRPSDAVFADDDGVVVVELDVVERVIELARDIAARERRQTEALRWGTTLREQLRFADYLRRRAEDSSYGFREHLRGLGGAIEE
jgi:4-hydroxy-4-methyl-2-oxoglutarate aldolase